jgi:hypothetical protein
MELKTMAEVEERLRVTHPIKPMITDPTFPTTSIAQSFWAKAVYYAMCNMEGVSDGEKLLKQWRGMMADEGKKVEIAAWKFLVRLENILMILSSS